MHDYLIPNIEFIYELIHIFLLSYKIITFQYEDIDMVKQHAYKYLLMMNLKKL